MNEFLWHEDAAFLELVKSPLAVLGLLLGIMLAVTAVLVIRSAGGSDEP